MASIRKVSDNELWKDYNMEGGYPSWRVARRKRRRNYREGADNREVRKGWTGIKSG